MLICLFTCLFVSVILLCLSVCCSLICLCFIAFIFVWLCLSVLFAHLSVCLFICLFIYNHSSSTSYPYCFSKSDLLVRCDGCETVLGSIEFQIQHANTLRKESLMTKQKVETEASDHLRARVYLMMMGLC